VNIVGPYDPSTKKRHMPLYLYIYQKKKKKKERKNNVRRTCAYLKRKQE
jgi:hypothetical protein